MKTFVACAHLPPDSQYITQTNSYIHFMTVLFVVVIVVVVVILFCTRTRCTGFWCVSVGDSAHTICVWVVGVRKTQKTERKDEKKI